MEIGNWKLEIGNLSFVALLFLSFLFFKPILISAQTTVDNTSSTQVDTTTPVKEESAWDKFWDWATGGFIKNKYTISQRDSSERISNQNNYNSEISSSGTRITSNSSQNCFKDDIIKKAIKGIYPDTLISHICPLSGSCLVDSNNTSCKSIKYSDLAAFFIQTNKQFCDSEYNLTNAEITAISSSPPISSTDLNCYQMIYDDIPIIPKDNVEEEENAQKIAKTPIPASGQKDVDDKELQTQLDSWVSPSGTSGGTKGLRPASW